MVGDCINGAHEARIYEAAMEGQNMRGSQPKYRPSHVTISRLRSAVGAAHRHPLMARSGHSALRTLRQL